MSNSTASLRNGDSVSDIAGASRWNLSSDPESWPPVIPSQPPTSTISDGGESIRPMEKPSIENDIAGRSHFLDKYACAVLILFAIVVWVGSALVAQVTFHHMDNMRHIGWAAQNVTVNGKSGKVYVPIFLTREAFEQNGGHP